MTIEIDPNVLLIEQEAKSTLLEFISKVVALLSAASTVVVLLMLCMEQLEHELVRRLKKKNPNESPVVEMNAIGK